MSVVVSETFTSPTNIAVIKYWGKDNVALNTPMNSSASLTLDQSDLHTITTVSASQSFATDRFWLNGRESELTGRAKKCITAIRKLAQDRTDPASGAVVVAKEDWPKFHLHISSFNTFPTGAGLASSAAGLACLVATLAKVFNAKESYPGEFTAIARQGSGSASRSLYGGFVRWQKGNKADGTDSIAVQIADENYWPEMRAIILVVSDREKDTSSTSGMETSKATSPLLTFRAANVVEPRLRDIEAAYLARDFETFGRITMQDSNQFHATCLDTYPPIFYMNDISKAIIQVVTNINRHCGAVKAAYTFDAGPNAVIYVLEKDARMVMSTLMSVFSAPNEPEQYCNRPAFYKECVRDSAILIPNELDRSIGRLRREIMPGDVKYTFYTKPGPGPVRLENESLLDNEGRPVPPGPNHVRVNIPSAAAAGHEAPSCCGSQTPAPSCCASGACKCGSGCSCGKGSNCTCATGCCSATSSKKACTCGPSCNCTASGAGCSCGSGACKCGSGCSCGKGSNCTCATGCCSVASPKKACIGSMLTYGIIGGVIGVVAYRLLKKD